MTAAPIDWDVGEFIRTKHLFSLLTLFGAHRNCTLKKVCDPHLSMTSVEKHFIKEFLS